MCYVSENPWPVSCLWKRSSLAHLQHWLDVKREWVSVYIRGQVEVMLCPHQGRGHFCDLWHMLPTWHRAADNHKATFLQNMAAEVGVITAFKSFNAYKYIDSMSIFICAHSIFYWLKKVLLKDHLKLELWALKTSQHCFTGWTTLPKVVTYMRENVNYRLWCWRCRPAHKCAIK